VWTPKIKDVAMVMVLVFKVLAYGQTYVHMYGQSRDKIFQIDGLPNFLRYGAPLTRLQHTGAPL